VAPPAAIIAGPTGKRGRAGAPAHGACGAPFGTLGASRPRCTTLMLVTDTCVRLSAAATTAPPGEPSYEMRDGEAMAPGWRILVAALLLVAGAGPSLAQTPPVLDAVAWGESNRTEAGEPGDVKRLRQPIPMASLRGATQVDNGCHHGLALMGDGTVRAWGDNRFGQLGDGTTRERSRPVEVYGLAGVRQVAATCWASFARLANGTVMAWGENRDGDLADGTADHQPRPVPVQGVQDAVHLTAGPSAAMAILANGTVVQWGSRWSGGPPVLLFNTSVERLVAYPNGSVRCVGPDGEDVPCSDSRRSIGRPQRARAVEGLANVTNLSVGRDFAVALHENGTATLWGWLQGRAIAAGAVTGRIHVGGLDGVTRVAAGDGHILALNANGTVSAWGANGRGQLGDGTNVSRAAPAIVPGLTGVRAIAASGDRSLAVMSNGLVQVWGDDAGWPAEQATQRTSPTTVCSVAGAHEAAFGRPNVALVEPVGVPAPPCPNPALRGGLVVAGILVSMAVAIALAARRAGTPRAAVEASAWLVVGMGAVAAALLRWLGVLRDGLADIFVTRTLAPEMLGAAWFAADVALFVALAARLPMQGHGRRSWWAATIVAGLVAFVSGAVTLALATLPGYHIASEHTWDWFAYQHDGLLLRLTLARWALVVALVLAGNWLSGPWIGRRGAVTLLGLGTTGVLLHAGAARIGYAELGLPMPGLFGIVGLAAIVLAAAFAVRDATSASQQGQAPA